MQQAARIVTDTRRFALRPLDLRRDLVRVHAWMNDPDVAQFWEKAWPIDQIDAYLQRQLDYDHSAPYIGELDDGFRRGVGAAYYRS